MAEVPGRGDVHFVIDSLGASGAEHSIAALLPSLVERGWGVTVSTLYDAGFGDEEAIRKLGYTVQPLRSPSFLGRVRELRARLRAQPVDVVHTTLFNSDIIGRLAALGTGAAVVSSLVNTPYEPSRMHDPNVGRAKLRVVQAIDSATIHVGVTTLHAVSEGVAEAGVRDLRVARDRIEVVHRGRSRNQLGHPSAERRRVAREMLGIPDELRIVLAAGRQEFQKAHVDLVAAAEHLASDRGDVVFLIAGREGNASAQLNQRLLTSPARDRIVLLGHRSDVPDLICAVDVLAISSLYEGTAGVALEAMALGCPVVCTDLTGVRGVLQDRVNSILVPPRDPRAMAAALDLVLSDRDLAKSLSAAGLNDYETRFTVEGAAEGMSALYTRTIAKKNRRRNARSH